MIQNSSQLNCEVVRIPYVHLNGALVSSNKYANRLLVFHNFPPVPIGRDADENASE